MSINLNWSFLCQQTALILFECQELLSRHCEYPKTAPRDPPPARKTKAPPRTRNGAFSCAICQVQTMWLVVSMQRVSWHTQLVDLILQDQLATLQLCNFGISGRGMRTGLGQFSFERIMFALEFCQVCLQGHPSSPPIGKRAGKPGTTDVPDVMIVTLVLKKSIHQVLRD